MINMNGNVENNVQNNVENANLNANEVLNKVEESTPNPKSNMSKIILAIAVLLIAVGAVLFFMNSGSGEKTKNKDNCIDKVKPEGFMGMNDQFAMASGKTQYVFGSSFDTDFISKVAEYDFIAFNICIKEGDTSSVSFQVGETTETNSTVEQKSR